MPGILPAALPDEVLTVIVVAVAALTLALAVAVVVLGIRLRRLRQARRTIEESDQDPDVLEAVARYRDQVAALRDDVAIAHERTDQLRQLLTGTVSRVGLVRYNAFENMGGGLSFSMALLDETSNGLVVSAINGRAETRMYAKPVVDGDSGHQLSSEEKASIEAAMEGRHYVDLASQSHRPATTS